MVYGSPASIEGGIVFLLAVFSAESSVDILKRPEWGLEDTTVTQASSLGPRPGQPEGTEVFRF